MKRFTDTEKWKDKWFRKLKPEHKLAFLYLLDSCDHAGSVELDEELAEFQIGCDLDWDAFREAMGDRVQVLECGRLWLVKFIDYQYGEISPTSNPHKPVRNAIEQYGIPYGELQVATKGYLKGTATLPDASQRDAQAFAMESEGNAEVSNENTEPLARVQDIYKDKDKDKDKNKDRRNASGTFRPPQLSDVKAFFVEIQEPEDLAAEFFDHYAANGWVQGKNKPLKDWQAAARNWARRKSQFSGGRSTAGTSLEAGVLK